MQSRTAVIRRVLLPAAAVATCALAATPVYANTPPPPPPSSDMFSISVSCVTLNADGTYAALFGYDNTSDTTITVPAGPNNTVAPAKLQGTQPTTFAPGYHPTSWRTAPVAAKQKIQWNVNGMVVVASASSPACGGSPIDLPAAGNGLAAPLVLAGSVPAAAGLVLLTRRRRPADS